MTQRFVNSFNITKVALFVSGVNLSKDKSILLNCLFLFNLLWLYSDVLGEFFWLFEALRVGKSFEEISMVVPCFVVCILATVRSAPLYYNNQLLYNILNKLQEIHPVTIKEDNVDERSVKEKEISERAVKFFSNLSIFMVIANVCVIIAFCVLPLVFIAVDYQQTGSIELKLPFLVKYFFDPFTMARWPIIYLHQIGSTIIVVMNLFGSDSFFHACCIYLTMHFELLRCSFEKVVTRSEEETEKRLRLCVFRHRQLIALVEQIEQLYSKPCLINIIMSSVLMCLSGFNIAFSKQFGTIFAFINFLLVCLFQNFLICYFGDMVVTSSSQIGEAIFHSTWYGADVKIKRSVHILILRSQKPCTLTAAKFATLNLRAFTTILSRSWSYFALLRTLYNN